MVGFFIQRPIFASAIATIMVLAGAICLFPAAGLAIPRDHAAAGRRQRQLSRRQRAGRRRHGDDAARAADQRRRGHDLHVLDQLERRLLDHHHHLRRRLSARYRRGRRAKPRLAGGLVAAGDRQSGRRDDQEAEPELRADRQSDLARPFGRSGRAVAITPPADRRSVEAPAWRRRRPDLRRAALFDARLARSRQARQPRRHRRRRPERASPSRTSRSRPARSASRRRRPARRSRCRSTRPGGWRPRAVRRHRRPRRSGQRRRGAAARCRPHRARRAAIFLDRLFRRGPDGRARHLPDARLECARPAAQRQGQDGGARRRVSRTGIAYAMHYDTTRFVSAAMHDVVDHARRGARCSSSSSSSSSCRAGARRSFRRSPSRCRSSPRWR